jgi:hypothetical protein
MSRYITSVEIHEFDNDGNHTGFHSLVDVGEHKTQQDAEALSAYLVFRAEEYDPELDADTED